EPGGRDSVLRAGLLPAPFHFTESFLKLKFLDLRSKIAVGRALLAIRSQRKRTDLDRITMLDWLREQQQPTQAIERFWRQVLVSAVNEELDRMAAAHGFQVFWLGFLAGSRSYEMGVPAVPLADLYSEKTWSRFPTVAIHERSAIERIVFENGKVAGVVVNGEVKSADAYISALPFERIQSLAPDLGLDLSAFTHSPITGIHLWFDRAVTDLPAATLLDRTLQ